MPMSTNTNFSRELVLAGILSTALVLFVPMVFAQQPASAVVESAQQPQNVSSAPESNEPQTLHLLVGRSLVISSPTRIKRVSLADPDIAEAIVVSPTQVL